MTDIFRELERLSLVNKLCTELSNHFGSESEFVVDKDVAEFVIHIAENSANIDKFTEDLSKNGAEFTEPFIANIYRMIKSHLSKSGQRKVEKSEKTKTDFKLKDINGNEIDVDPSWIFRDIVDEEKKLRFPALCIKDDIPMDKLTERDDNRDIVDLTLKQESLKKEGNSLAAKEQSMKNRARDKKHHKSHKHRSRSRSPTRRHYKRSRSRSPQANNRRGDKNRDYSPERRHSCRSRRSLTPLDNEAVVGNVYKGNVTGVMKYGCFVSLKGIKRRCEGLVHVSQMLAGVRVSEPQEVVSRGDSVYVKVLSILGEKIRLSMKEACQKTGKDIGDCKPLMSGGEVGQLVTQNPEYDEDEEVSNSAQRAWTGGGGRQRVRCTSPEKWELKQLVAAGVMELEDLPWYSEETGILRADAQDDSDEDIDIGELSVNRLIHGLYCNILVRAGGR